MAVEAVHLLPTNPMMMMMIDAVDKQSDGIFRLGYCTDNPFSGTTTTADTLFPMYSSGFTNPDPFKEKSDLSCSIPVSRKRSRDFSSVCTFSDSPNRNPMERCVNFTFLGEDISYQIQQQQLEIDQFVVLHTEKVRREIEEKRKRNWMKLMAALEEGVTQRLMAKEEKIAKIARLNCALEEKVKSLCIENQIWRELAQTNEATANGLRNNLKQVVDSGYRNHSTAAGAVALADDDADQSSNNGNECMLGEQDSMKRLCKSCGEAESCVLLLPCRHLCLCTVCVSSVDICPICKSAKNISVHVHFS